MMLSGSIFLRRNLGKRIVEAMEGSGEDIKRGRLMTEGYWPLTQRIVRDVLPKNRDDDKQIIFAGHSQGGFRAAMASMWLEKFDGTIYPVYSLAGTGTQCVSRA